MLQSLFILGDSGEVMFEKQWGGRGGDRTVCEWFWEQVKKAPSITEVPCVIAAPQCYVLHIVREGVVFLACCANEMPPLLGIEFVKSVADVLGEYVGGLSEDGLKDHFVAVYEVLEEMMDCGFPLTTEPGILKELVPPPSMVSRVVNVVAGVAPSGPSAASAAAIPNAIGSAVPWRGATIRHAANEIYCDLMEELDAVVDRNGMVIRSDIYGELQVTSRLSGVPDVTITFANPSIISDVQMHRCVRLHTWEAERALVCIPPDGRSKLMAYRVRGVRNTPIYVKPQMSFSGGSCKVSILLGLKSDPGRPLEGVTLQLPLAKALLSADLTANHGTVTVDHVNKICTWTVGKLPKDKVPCMTGSVQLKGGVGRLDEHPTLLLSFRIPGCALSGLKVSGMTVANESYRPYKGFRALTKAGCVEFRT